MKASFTLPIKGFSVNSTYYASRRVKTKDFREWEVTAEFLLQNEPSLKEFKKQFDAQGGRFTVWFSFYYPINIFYNKFGQVSAKTLDLSNVEKTLQDAIFREIGVDDRYVTVLHSRKLSAPEYRIDVSLELNRDPEPDDALASAP